MNSITNKTPCRPPKKALGSGWQDAVITRITDHAPTGSLSWLYPLYEFHKMGDIFGVKYPFWICATILNKYVHVFLVRSQIRWYQFQVVIWDYSRQKALKRCFVSNISDFPRVPVSSLDHIDMLFCYFVKVILARNVFPTCTRCTQSLNEL